MKPISIQYPIVELSVAATFLLSFISWPYVFHGSGVILFCIWLFILTCLLALLVYDLKYMLLPDRITAYLAGFGALFALVNIICSSNPAIALINVVLAVAIGGGIFYLLFQVSAGKWIGGGDVKLGWAMGLFLTLPSRSLLMIFIASLLGTLVSLPLLISKKLKQSSVIPFGPFLIIGAIIAVLYGSQIIDWYSNLVLIK